MDDKLQEEFRKEFSIYPIAVLLEERILKWVRSKLPQLSERWYYESDGDEHSKTHYLVRANDPGFVRIDFSSKQEALKILKELNKY